MEPLPELEAQLQAKILAIKNRILHVEVPEPSGERVIHMSFADVCAVLGLDPAYTAGQLTSEYVGTRVITLEGGFQTRIMVTLPWVFFHILAALETPEAQEIRALMEQVKAARADQGQDTFTEKMLGII